MQTFPYFATTRARYAPPPPASTCRCRQRLTEIQDTGVITVSTTVFDLRDGSVKVNAAAPVARVAMLTAGCPAPFSHWQRAGV